MLWYEQLDTIHFDVALAAFENEPGLMLLHSSMLRSDVGRYSFLCVRPFACFVALADHYLWNDAKIEGECPWAFIQSQLQRYALPKAAHLPPFQSGIVGYWGYEFAHTLERFPEVPDEIELPKCVLNFYENVVAFDHQTQRLFLMASGFPALELEARKHKAQAALDWMKAKLHQPSLKKNHTDPSPLIKETIHSNFTPAAYQQAVSEIRTHILDGDIFQANLTQQFKGSLLPNINHMQWYLQLCKKNPSPFSAFLRIGNQAWILSASPERFVSLMDDNVRAEPIKGTRARVTLESENQAFINDLVNSKKDKAENVMIVDLMRNDLSKVCLPGSIEVSELCALYSFETVHHLISVVKGVLAPQFNAIDLLKATFPPGSVTGAPKIKAMEIIGQMEKTTRGPYCGCFGYISFTGDMDTAVTIRTYAVNEDRVYFGAGGGIVLDSDPKAEYEESVLKAARLQTILDPKGDTWSC